MHIQPIADHCGAEASGIDLKTLDDAGIDALKAAVPTAACCSSATRT